MASAISQGRTGIRVLIADSTRMGSQLLAEALQRERRFKVIACAATWDEVLAALPASPEVVVLAVNFGKTGGGLEIPARIAGQPRPALLILLDNAGDSGLVVHAFREGARGVFSRTQSLPEMCKCIECLARGEIWATGEQINYILEGLKRSVVPRFLNSSGMSLLSRREQEVVRYLCDGLTNREIARALGLSEHTVKNHLLRVYTKLGVDKRMEVIFSLLSRAPAADPFPFQAAPPVDALQLQEPAPADSNALRWCLEWSEYSLRAQYMLGRKLQHGEASQEDPFTAYTLLLRSERGATELIDKCRAIRELLGSHLTPEQRRQAETGAARPWPRQLRSRVPHTAPAPTRKLPVAHALKQNP
jgi:two-component system nitrate/nitrite response regulator NarL